MNKKTAKVKSEEAEVEATETNEEGETETEATEGEELNEDGLKSLIHAAVRERFEKDGATVATAVADAVKDQRGTAKTTERSKRVDFDTEKYKSFAKAVGEGSGQSTFVFEVKDFNFANEKSVSFDDNITGEYPLPELEAGFTRAPQRQPFIEELVSVGTIASNSDAWVEVSDASGDPATVAELADIPEKDYDYVRRTADVKKVAVMNKHSREILEDLPSLASDIQNNLVADLRKLIDQQILTGDGIGENLVGIMENATAFAAGDLAGTVVEPNHFDAIEAAVTQVVNAYHEATHVVVNPTDFARMRLTKATDGHYVMPPFISNDGTVISDVRVVRNRGITAGTFLVGDFSKCTVKYRTGLRVEMTNTDGSDFKKDMFSVKATARLVARVKQNDYGAFVTGTFATAIAALEVSA